jgi:hypothetical protein
MIGGSMPVPESCTSSRTWLPPSRAARTPSCRGLTLDDAHFTQGVAHKVGNHLLELNRIACHQRQIHREVAVDDNLIWLQPRGQLPPIESPLRDLGAKHLE